MANNDTNLIALGIKIGAGVVGLILIAVLIGNMVTTWVPMKLW